MLSDVIQMSKGITLSSETEINLTQYPSQRWWEIHQGLNLSRITLQGERVVKWHGGMCLHFPLILARVASADLIHWWIIMVSYACWSFSHLGLTPDHALEKTSFSYSLLSNPAVLWGIILILTKIGFFTSLHRRQNDCMYTAHLKKQVCCIQNKVWEKWPTREEFKMLTVLSSMYLTFDNEYLIMEYLFVERYKPH